ncbi:hypothetical protein VKT23_015113 [Stygiomarasmius scandens]|uniref:Uncharacterized protein n=1 Tax=Marasmiellus scandens TaxID=2682957 RepID=A0ABR1J379_9AGAR
MLVNRLFPLIPSLFLIPTCKTSSVTRESEHYPQPCPDPPDLSGIPDKTSSGRLMLVAHVKVAEGREAEYEEVINEVKAFRDAGGEPGTLTYRVTRIVDENANPTGEYISIEEYTGKKLPLK